MSHLIKLSHNDQQQLLCTLDGLPPEGYRAVYVHPEQFQRWDEARRHFGFIRLGLQAYFASKPLPNNLFSCPSERNLYDLYRRFYTTFYDLVYSAWEQITQTCINHGISCPETPSDVVIADLKQGADEWLIPTYAKYYVVSVKRVRSILRPGKKLQALLEQPYTQLSKPDRRKVDTHWSEVRKLRSGRDIRWTDFCAAIADQHKSNLLIADALKTFLDADATLGKYVASMISESSGICGEQWNDGAVKIATHRGGTYS